MNEELYKPWEPFPGMVRPKYVEGIHDDYEGFRILLRGESPSSPMLRLQFDSSQLFYRIMEEASWLNPGVPKSLIAALHRGHRFFMVENSKLLQWFAEMSQGTRDSPDVRHYFICMSNEVIDVIASHPPRADNLNDPDV